MATSRQYPHPGAGEPEVIHYVVTVLLLAVAVWIFIANVLIILAPRVHQPLKKKTYLFTSSLAAADLVTSFCVPAAWFIGTMARFAPDWFYMVLSKPYCQTLLFCYAFPLLSSICNLLMIAVDRYVAIAHSLMYDSVLTRKRCKILIGLCWIFALSAASVNFFWNKYERSEDFNCNVLDVSPLYFHCFLAVWYWLASSAIVILYMRVYFAIKRSKFTLRPKIQTKPKTTQGQGQDNSSENRVAKTMFITLTVFSLCWTPFVVILHLLVAERVSMVTVFPVMILTYTNSGMNVFIYAMKCKNYRVAFKKMLGRCCKVPCLTGPRVGATPSNGTLSEKPA